VIEVMIVEDQTMVRDAIKGALSKTDDLRVTSSLADAALALLYYERTRPGVVLMDVCTENDSSGLDAAEQIKRKHPDAKIVMMTGLPELTFVERARAAGADSFIYKDSPLEELERVIRETAAGGHLYPRPQAGADALNFGELTKREREVLRLICDGLSRQEIADALCITINSVKTHFANILSKTGYESVTKLAIYAVSHGLINTLVKD